VYCNHLLRAQHAETLNLKHGESTRGNDVHVRSKFIAFCQYQELHDYDNIKCEHQPPVKVYASARLPVTTPQDSWLHR